MSAFSADIDGNLLDAIDAFRRQSDSGDQLTRNDAVNVIVRDWLQGQGFLAIPGDTKHRTARKAAGVPTGHLDP